MSIRHIFFDLDNTLWDHRKNAWLTLQKLFIKYDIEELYHIQYPDFHRKYDEINEELWEKIRDGKIDKEYLRKHRFYDTFLYFGVDNFELSQVFEFQFLDEIIENNELVPGSIEILEYLFQKEYKIHIISNGFYEVTHRKIDGSGLRKYVETVTSADDVQVRKPHPKIFSHALEIAGANKENSVLVGDDWIADVLGAKNFGLKVIFFDALHENLQEEGVINIQELTELKNYL